MFVEGAIIGGSLAFRALPQTHAQENRDRREEGSGEGERSTVEGLRDLGCKEGGGNVAGTNI